MKKIVNTIKFYLMRSIRSKYIRDHITKSVANKIGKTLNNASESKLIHSNNVQAHIDSIVTHGFSELSTLLPNEKIELIQNYLTQLNCFDPFHIDVGDFKIENVSHRTHVANYYREDLIRNKVIMDIANDPGFLFLAQEFLGATPTISNINAWWSISGKETAEDAQLFHRDVDDFKFIKLFIYLTDVSENHGPHVYVKGSSASNKLLKIRRYSDEEIINVFGEESIINFTRPKGSIFFVDTYGFHKGLLPKLGNRLILQIQYSLNPIGVENYKPLKVDRFEYNRYINRCLIK